VKIPAQAMKIIEISNPGKAYRLILGEARKPEPGPDDVLIQIAAAGLNRADLLQARGLYRPPPGASAILGMEVSGTIAALGRDVSGFTVGERVCALLSSGGYAEFACADSGCVLPAPTDIDLIQAAGLPEAAFTAWTNVMDTGRLRAGETLLIHGGTSGIGSLAIQIFAARGHQVFTTVGSDEKCETARKLGAARAINYRREDFVAVVKEETAGKGVDVILDMIGGDYIQRNIAAASLWGRIVNIAYQNGFKAEVDFAPVLRKHLTLAATLLRPRKADEKRAIRDALLIEVWPLLGSRIHPVTARVFPLEQAQQAHEFMAKTGHTGKILLSIP
jgi:putative PIG3 family NAD(P)H quinone oxidoreductase